MSSNWKWSQLRSTAILHQSETSQRSPESGESHRCSREPFLVKLFTGNRFGFGFYNSVGDESDLSWGRRQYCISPRRLSGHLTPQPGALSWKLRKSPAFSRTFPGEIVGVFGNWDLIRKSYMSSGSKIILRNGIHSVKVCTIYGCLLPPKKYKRLDAVLLSKLCRPLSVNICCSPLSQHSITFLSCSCTLHICNFCLDPKIKICSPPRLNKSSQLFMVLFDQCIIV